MESLDTPESTSSKFFGSPSEPIYTDSKHTLNADLLQDSLTLLSSKNDSVLSIIQESTVEKNKDDCMEFKSGSPILFLFELCRYFKLAPEVQYRAAELFHRFMISHIIELYQVNNYVVLSTWYYRRWWKGVQENFSHCSASVPITNSDLGGGP